MSPVSGILLKNGQAWSQQTLSVNSLSAYKDDPCADPIVDVRTNEAGLFVIPEITARKFLRNVVLAPSSPTYRMTLCHQTPDGLDVIFDETIWATLPRHLDLSCRKSGDDGTDCEIVDWTGWNYVRSHPDYGQERPE